MAEVVLEASDVVISGVVVLVVTTGVAEVVLEASDVAEVVLEASDVVSFSRYFRGSSTSRNHR